MESDGGFQLLVIKLSSTIEFLDLINYLVFTYDKQETVVNLRDFCCYFGIWTTIEKKNFIKKNLNLFSTERVEGI